MADESPVEPARGSSDQVRDAAIAAARNAFAAGSYARTTFKGLAAAAGVAPTVLRKYYDNKDAVFAAALIGACLGFLWYNAPPAAVFMGDTGSLALGGALGSIAVITNHELVLVVIGGLFVLETVSVIVQVISFKTTGKRVFRMAPIHHHFEQLGWSEPTVVIRFWIVAFVLALAGLSTLKLR